MSKRKKSVELPKLRKYGRIEFWVDYHLRRSAIVVECDDPNYPVVAVYKFQTKIEEERCRRVAQELVRRIIDGKVDYRKRSLKVPREFRWDRTYVGNRG